MSDDIQLFLSWAHDDAKLKESFLKLLKTRLTNVPNHAFTWWEDSFILPGEEWKEEIRAQLAEADYIVQLISPSFLASTFIRDYEIPGVGEAPLKKTLPVMLVDVPLDGTVEFHQIERRQIYRGNSIEPHSYVSRETDYQRNRFVDGFVSQMIRRIEGGGGWR
jgi:hypothetical protein